jgi:glycosyltransferase involved in cell wall biosynthesis
VTVIHQPNLGAAAARNRGLRATTAEFVALLDADDEWFPTFIAELGEVLRHRVDLDLVYSDGLITGQTGLAGQRFMQSCPSVGEVTFESLLEQRCTVLLSGVVMRRQAAVEAGGFDLEIRRGQDFDLWLRMAFRGARMTYLRRPLVLRRVHDQNLSGTAINEQERPLRVLEKVVATLPLSEPQQILARRRIQHLNGTLAREQGKEFLRRGDFSSARREFARSQYCSFSWKTYAALIGLRVAPHVVRRLYLIRAAALVSSQLSPVRHVS